MTTNVGVEDSVSQFLDIFYELLNSKIRRFTDNYDTDKLKLISFRDQVGDLCDELMNSFSDENPIKESELTQLIVDMRGLYLELKMNYSDAWNLIQKLEDRQLNHKTITFEI